MNAYSRHYNTIVIGVGGMGSATCYELAKRGKRVLGLEQFDIPHDRARRTATRASSAWPTTSTLPTSCCCAAPTSCGTRSSAVRGEQLLHMIGSIDAGPADSWVFKGSFQSAVEMDIAHEVLTGLELTQRFPGYRLPQDIMALYQPDGGFLTPERCIVSYVNAALALGAEIHGREQVLGWEPRGDGVRVFTDRATYEADCAGLDRRLLEQPVDALAARPGRAGAAGAGLAAAGAARAVSARHLPGLQLLVDEGRFYGFPVYGVPGFKFGKYHHFEETGAPEAAQPRGAARATRRCCASSPRATSPRPPGRR